MHLLDTTLFYSPTSGGVKRYLTAKHAWLGAHTSWEHTIVVPGSRDHLERGGVCTLSGYPVPGTFNYRLPLNPRRWANLMSALEPIQTCRGSSAGVSAARSPNLDSAATCAGCTRGSTWCSRRAG